MSEQQSVVVVCGPSGVGKGTLIKWILQEFPSDFTLGISHTSRSMREWEIDGISYHFVKESTMQEMEQRSEFAEMCKVHTYSYGTSFRTLQDVLESGRVPILELDVQGAQKIQTRTDLHCHCFYIRAPSIQVLEQRIRSRGVEDVNSIPVRLRTAVEENAFAEAHPEAFARIIVNDQLDRAYHDLKQSLMELGLISSPEELSGLHEIDANMMPTRSKQNVTKKVSQKLMGLSPPYGFIDPTVSLA